MHPRDAADPAAVHGASLGARRDVVEHELVRALGAIPVGQFEDVSHDAMVAKAHALDDLAVPDVEAGNYAAGKNGCNSSAVSRPSSSARPLMTAVAPVAASSCRSAAPLTPPEAP